MILILLLALILGEVFLRQNNITEAKKQSYDVQAFGIANA